MIDGLIRWSLRTSHDRGRARGRVPRVGRVVRVAHPARRAARSHRADGDHPGRGAGHGSARDGVAGHVPDRIGAERRRRRAPRALGDRRRRRGRVGGVRLGPGHQPGPPDRHREADPGRRASLPPASSRRSSRRSRRSWARCCSSPSSRIDTSPLELRTIAETVVRRRLLAVPGVSQVIATGGDQKQYEVVLDPARLASHQVTRAGRGGRRSRRRTGTRPPAFRSTEGQEYLVRGVGRLADVDAIAQRARDERRRHAGARPRRRCRARRRRDQAGRRLAQRASPPSSSASRSSRASTRWS